MLNVTVVLLGDGLASTALGPLEVFFAAGVLFQTLLETREEREDALAVLVDGGVVAAHERAEGEVLVDGQIRENAATFRAVAHTQPDDLVGLEAGDRLAIEQHLSGRGPDHAGNGAERRRLARAVATDERQDLPLLDRQIDPVQGLDGPVSDAQILHFQQWHAVDSVAW